MDEEESILTPYRVEDRRPIDFQRIVLALQVAAALGIGLLWIGLGKVPGLDLIGLIVVILIVWRARARFFLLDFAPFLLLVPTYEMVRMIGMALSVVNLHVTDIIGWERALFFGAIPSYLLQNALGSQTYTWLIDIVMNGFYMTHFFSVLILGIILWRYRRSEYWPFLLGFCVLTYAAFLTYIVFPAAPPWWASQNGYLTGQAVNLSHSLLSPEYITATGDPLAAMPSLHAAYPFYLSLYCLFLWGRKVLPVLILPAMVAIASMYLGHHYVIDILAGLVYATVAFLLTVRWTHLQRLALQTYRS
jgi:membrane-associated phospholipid phosphatase